ncbi:MAG: uracil-DNA glycosylase [Desulfobacteraceae bacterium]|nr:uracil-DNA glycosylase [Desulfobacteraceae bacterium]
MSPTDSPGLLLRAVRRLLALHADWGLETYPQTPGLTAFLAPRPQAPPPGRTPMPPRPAPPARKTAKAPAPGPQAPPPAESLGELQAELGDCRRCGLCSARGKIVFGEGDPQARLLVVGKCPGPDDDRTGRPFQGEAGELLTRMLAAIGLSRQEVYLTTAVKCWPGPEAGPKPDQLAACLPYLRRQLAAVSPQVICALGATTAQALLHSHTPLHALRGRFHDCQGLPLRATFAPDLLLKHQELKQGAWQDLKAIQARLGQTG